MWVTTNSGFVQTTVNQSNNFGNDIRDPTGLSCFHFISFVKGQIFTDLTVMSARTGWVCGLFNDAVVNSNTVKVTYK